MSKKLFANGKELGHVCERYAELSFVMEEGFTVEFSNCDSYVTETDDSFIVTVQ